MTCIWDSTDPAAWTVLVSVRADSMYGVLDKIVNWKITNGDFSNLSESPDYSEIMDTIIVLVGPKETCKIMNIVMVYENFLLL